MEEVQEDILVVRVDVVEKELLDEVEGGRVESRFNKVVLRSEEVETPCIFCGTELRDVRRARGGEDMVDCEGL